MNIINIKKVDCENCYKCVRSCPLKAIRIKKQHAEVVEERCILDGKCVAVCPHNVKEIEDGLNRVKELLASKFKVIVSLAPSFAGLFDLKHPGQMVSALHKLGFAEVEETAWAAEMVATEHIKMLETLPKPVLTSSCPAIVGLVEIYYPELIPHLARVVSPMIAHGRMLKADHTEDMRVVFIGPCIAKKKEMVDVPGAIDGVLTFVELKEWFEEEHINIGSLAEEEFANESPKWARLFPLEGGLLKTASINPDMLSREVLVISGVEECKEFLKDFGKNIPQKVNIIEMLACPEGCINGPGIKTEYSLLARRQKILGFSKDNEGISIPIKKFKEVDLSRSYADRRITPLIPTDEDIGGLLSSIGKFTPEDETNCGACGYDSCREKAVAVYQGMAEIEMCIPYMRTKAESMIEIITESIPSGVIVVAGDMTILNINAAARELFSCQKRKLIGNKLNTIIDDNYFRKAFSEQNVISGEVSYPGYELIFQQTILFVPKHNIAVGIFIDITKQQRHIKEEERRKESFSRAHTVINKQMRVAQEIAGLLGETTAETKASLLELLKLMEGK